MKINILFDRYFGLKNEMFGQNGVEQEKNTIEH